MNSPSTDLAQFLEGKGYGTIGTDLHVSYLPPKPDKCVALLDSGSWEEFNGLTNLEHPTVQVLVRGVRSGFQDQYQLAHDIWKELVFLTNSTRIINGTHYSGVWLMSGPIFTGYDESKRPVYSINFRVMRSG